MRPGRVAWFDTAFIVGLLGLGLGLRVWAASLIVAGDSAGVAGFLIACAAGCELGAGLIVGTIVWEGLARQRAIP